MHGCQMPEQLLGRIIRACSNEGDLVLDPFAGSGTTLAVAKKLGRKFLGFELSADYAERVNERLQSDSAGDPLDGAEEPLVSAPSTAQGRRLDAQANRKPRNEPDAARPPHRNRSPASPDAARDRTQRRTGSPAHRQRTDGLGRPSYTVRTPRSI